MVTLFLLLIAAVVSSPALAASTGLSVERVSTWNRSADAMLMRGGTSTSLSEGMDLQAGDLIRTGTTSITIRSPKGETCTLFEGEEVRVGSRRLDLQGGKIYCQVSGPFEVSILDVLVGVKGTRFLVEEGVDGIRIQVSDGVVEVSKAGELIAEVESGEELWIPLQGAASPSQWRGLLRAEALAAAVSEGRGMLTVGAAVDMGGENVDHDLLASVGMRAYLRVSLTRRLQLEIGTGLRTVPGQTSAGLASDGLRIPLSGGLQTSIGPIQITGQGLTETESILCRDGRRMVIQHFGGMGAARYSVPVGRRIRLEGELRTSWLDRDQVTVSGGVGVSFALVP